MKHYGDITKLHGDRLPVVDVVVGGSPCQDLSVAGKRSGLEGERSGLFYDYIRVVKEMRERDRATGRADEFIRPRFLVFENVPGLLSSGKPKGTDFQAVLTEIARIAEPECPDVPMPDKRKWAKSGCIYDEVGNWSIAWRLFDSQFWGTTLYDDEGNVLQLGTPQRRKRIALIADFSGLSASEVLFVKQSVCRNSTESGEPRKTSSRNTEESIRDTDEPG